MFKELAASKLKSVKREQLIKSTLILLVLIGFIELAVMFLIHPLNLSESIEALIDAFLLVTLLTPCIYWLFVKRSASVAEQSLYDSLELSDNLVKAMPAGIYIYEFIAPDQLILVDANKAAEKMTDRVLSAWKGREFNEIWPEAKAMGITDRFLSVACTGVSYIDENLIYKDNALSIDIMVHVFKLPNDYLAVSFIDITERKQAELALEKSRDEVQGLANTLEHRVEERTLSLKEANAQLLKEIVERREVEQRLAQLNKELELLSYQDGLT